MSKLNYLNFVFLESVATITRLAGYEYSTLWKEAKDGEIIALRGFNIGANKINDREVVRISNDLSLKLNRSRLYKGDVVYPCVGTIGNAAVIQENDKFHIQQNIAKITPGAELDSNFLCQFLMSDLALKEVKKFNATSSQPNVLVGSLRKYLIPLPPLPEQQKIARILSTWDELIDKQTKLIAAKEKRKQALMQKLLSGEVRLAEFKKEKWKIAKMSGLGEFKNGINKGKEDFGKGVPFVNLMDVFGKSSISANGLSLVNATVDEILNYSLKKGDVLFVRSSVKPSGVGLTAVIDQDIPNTVYSGFLIRFRSNGLLDSTFLKYCFNELSFRNQMLSKSSVSAVTNINQESLNSLIIKYPSSISEQQFIASVLIACETELDSLKTQLENYKFQKQGMMQELLTGKIRAKI
ncbi:restriction endonuclease subunit S [soil metagenome]